MASLVSGLVLGSNGSPYSGATIAFFHLSAPTPVGTSFAASLTQQIVAAANGSFSVNLVPGEYQVTFNNKDTCRIVVPLDNQSYDFNSLVTEAGSFTVPDWWLTPGVPATSLATLTDVAIVSPADNDLLAFDTATGEWKNVTAASLGLTGGSGSVWYSATGVPSNGSGADGDFYLNKTNGDIYQKIAGAWVFQVNLTGPTGAAGTNGASVEWHVGSGTPANGLGDTLDMYLNNLNGDVYKKVGVNDWDLVGNILGPTGATGAAGASGAAGTNGSVWHFGSGTPSGGLGANTDAYLNTANGDVYAKVAGSWGSPVGNIKGPAGTGGGSGVQFFTPTNDASGNPTNLPAVASEGTVLVAKGAELGRDRRIWRSNGSIWVLEVDRVFPKVQFTTNSDPAVAFPTGQYTGDIAVSMSTGNVHQFNLAATGWTNSVIGTLSFPEIVTTALYNFIVTVGSSATFSVNHTTTVQVGDYYIINGTLVGLVTAKSATTISFSFPVSLYRNVYFGNIIPSLPAGAKIVPADRSTIDNLFEFSHFGVVAVESTLNKTGASSFEATTLFQAYLGATIIIGAYALRVTNITAGASNKTRTYQVTPISWPYAAGSSTTLSVGTEIRLLHPTDMGFVSPESVSANPGASTPITLTFSASQLREIARFHLGQLVTIVGVDAFGTFSSGASPVIEYYVSGIDTAAYTVTLAETANDKSYTGTISTAFRVYPGATLGSTGGTGLSTRTGVYRERFFSAKEFALDGATVVNVNGNLLFPALQFADGVTQKAGITFAMPSSWNGGAIKFRIHTAAPDLDGENVRVKYDFGISSAGDVWNEGAFLTSSATVAVPVVADEDANYTVSFTPASHTNGATANDRIIFCISRLGADGADTHPNVFWVTGVSVQWLESETEPSIW